MTTRSVFIAWNTDLTSGINWPLNSSSTSIPHFLNNTTGLLFRQPVTSHSSVHQLPNNYIGSWLLV
jgi:hypothetical protein